MEGQIFAVSYDVYGDENEIETYLFSSLELSEKETCILREIYECLYKQKLQNNCSLPSFETWVKAQGYSCKKIPQYRVEPLIRGKAEGYDSYLLDQ